MSFHCKVIVSNAKEHSPERQVQPTLESREYFDQNVQRVKSFTKNFEVTQKDQNFRLILLNRQMSITCLQKFVCRVLLRN